MGFAGCGSDGDESGGETPDRFDSAAAFELIEEQVAVGQRPAGSPQLRKLSERLRAELPNGTFEPVPGGLRNVVGSLPGPAPAVLIGAHYDTEAHPPGFVGANDGAAGTAAVIELARTLERELPEGHNEVRFVLFDGEEEPPGCPDAEFAQCALRGSKAYVASHSGEGQVGEMILLDYVANKGLHIPREGNSDPGLWAKLRAAAIKAGVEQYFPSGEQPPLLDDHLPFVEAGVTSIDLIDFSYEYADTVEDTPDKLDPAALDAVGEAVAELVLVEAGP
jgi:Zn-dependent M28 family amino/carboxypeptidase